MPEQTKKASFFICILMDLVGYATYIIPVFGEYADIVWAPVSGYIFYRMFGGWKGVAGGLFNIIEEILPGLDFIPTFSVMWMVQFFVNSKTDQLR